MSRDADWSKSVTEERERTKKDFARFAGSYVPTRNLDFETKIRLMSQFGNEKRLEQIQDFWQ